MNENSRFGEHFRDGQCSLVSFLVCCSSTHGAPRAQPFLKVAGGACPRALWSRRHCTRVLVNTESTLIIAANDQEEAASRRPEGNKRDFLTSHFMRAFTLISPRGSVLAIGLRVARRSNSNSSQVSKKQQLKTRLQ